MDLGSGRDETRRRGDRATRSDEQRAHDLRIMAAVIAGGMLAQGLEQGTAQDYVVNTATAIALKIDARLSET